MPSVFNGITLARSCATFTYLRARTGIGNPLFRCGDITRILSQQNFHSTRPRDAVRPYLLADIGEGITECRIIEWFVKPGDTVQQFDAVCEVQSDKASVEITSRYDGRITKIHYEVDDMAKVGQPLLDIDTEESSEGNAPVEESGSEAGSSSQPTSETFASSETPSSTAPQEQIEHEPSLARNSGQVVPAVRLMLKEHGLDLKDIPGTGKGGRVLKEDVQRYLSSRTEPAAKSTTPKQDVNVPLSPSQNEMFKVMTASLNIPHFGFTHSVDMTKINALRQRCNASKELADTVLGKSTPKLTLLPIIMKALSMAFQHHPKLNAHLDVECPSGKPQFILKGSHDFGVAIDTPKGLLVPVVKGVQDRSIVSIAEEINRLSELAKASTLKPSDFKGATFTVSNIGSIGGNVVSPVIVSPMVGIVGIGKLEEVPVFMESEDGQSHVVKRQTSVLSWSADHRVLDGASVARCANLVSEILEDLDAVGLAMI